MQRSGLDASGGFFRKIKRCSFVEGIPPFLSGPVQAARFILCKLRVIVVPDRFRPEA